MRKYDSIVTSRVVIPQSVAQAEAQSWVQSVAQSEAHAGAQSVAQAENFGRFFFQISILVEILENLDFGRNFRKNLDSGRNFHNIFILD